MKLLMRYKPGWGPEAVVIGAADDSANRYNRFLGGALWSEFKTVESCNAFLNAVDSIEKGTESETCFSGNAWIITISSAGVTIEFAAEESCFDTFSLAEIKCSILGWKSLLQHSSEESSSVVVEL